MKTLRSVLFISLLFFVWACSDNIPVSSSTDVISEVSTDVAAPPIDVEHEVQIDTGPEVKADVVTCVEHSDCKTKPCQTAWCNSDGECVFEFATLLSPCEDGSVCTQNDKCNASHVCQPGVLTKCDDGNKCTVDSCDPIAGCVYLNLPSNSQCDDGSTCTTNDKCDNGTCKGEEVNCDDGNVCTKDQCVQNKGCLNDKLTNTPCDDGSACTKNDTCLIGACQGEVNPCDDGNSCTYNKCDSKTGCSYTPVNDGNQCEDGNKCTLNDSCLNSVCQPGKAQDCNDNNACTADSCESATGKCVNKAIEGANYCDDSNECTKSDMCNALGNCVGQVIICTDGKPCTKDLCSPKTGCNYPLVPDGTTCDDGQACTYGDICSSGKCKGNVDACEDGNLCTLDSCNPATGVCNHTAFNGISCDDGNACTLGTTCSETTCVGTQINCDDNNSCTDDFCNPVNGCYHATLTGKCDDKNPCTVQEFCNGSICTGKPVTCDDKDKCTTDACDTKTGVCTNSPIPNCVP